MRVLRESYVYRAFDSYGLLLYIGCSQNVAARMTQHSGQPWFRYAETIASVGPWPRPEAMARERDAIESEASYFNCSAADNGRTRKNYEAALRRLAPTKPELDRTRLYDYDYVENEWAPLAEGWSRALDRERERLTQHGFPCLTPETRLARYLAARKDAELARLEAAA